MEAKDPIINEDVEADVSQETKAPEAPRKRYPADFLKEEADAPKMQTPPTKDDEVVKLLKDINARLDSFEMNFDEEIPQNDKSGFIATAGLILGALFLYLFIVKKGESNAKTA